MAKNRTISLTDDAEVSLDRKRQEDRSFNLSAFISMCLTKDFGMNNQTIEQLNHKNSEIDAKIQLLITEKEGNILKIKNIMENSKQLQKEKEEQEKYEKEKKDIEHFLANQTLEEIEEYKQGIKIGKWKGSVEFARIKLGYEK